MFTAIPIHLYCTSIKRPTSIRWPLNRGRTVECPEQAVRKDEQPMEIDSVINEILNKLRF